MKAFRTYFEPAEKTVVVVSSHCEQLVCNSRCWEDFVDDLWKNNLSHFRNGNYSYAIVCTVDQKRRVYSLRNIDRNDEDLLNDLMNAGVSETNLLRDTDVEESSSRSPSLNSRLSHPTITMGAEVDDVESSFATSMNAQGKFLKTASITCFVCRNISNQKTSRVIYL